MRERIRQSLIATLKPRERPYDVRDSQLRGFVARVHPSGRISYLAVYGRGRSYAIAGADKLTADEARAEARKVLAKAALGQDPMAEKRERRSDTLGEFIKGEYAPWRRARSKWGGQTIGALQREFGDLYSKRLAEVTPWIVEKWRSAGLKAGRKAKTLNRHLDTLKSVLSKAVEWGYVPVNPLAKVRRLKVDRRGRVRYLEPDEETRLRTALVEREADLRQRRERFNAWRVARGHASFPDFPGDHLRPLVLLALNSGMRRGELLSLRWGDVDLSRRQVTIRGETAKSGQTRHIPLNSEACATLEAWRPADVATHRLVFPHSGENRDGKAMAQVNSSWRSLMKRSKIVAFRFHDLRHSFASKLVMAGVDLNTVRELLGHADFDMTLRYAHLAPQHKADAVEKLVRRAVG